MAKKGAGQLQANLQSDEELDDFLKQRGLLVIDVYSEWCGPCLGMVNSLRKIKMELGGDTLLLAIAKADSISYLNRFCKKSEPTWLFVTAEKVVNIMFGADSPRLMDLIKDELALVGKSSGRERYNINEALPEEKVLDAIRNEAKNAKELKKAKDRENKKRDYFYFVTDTIKENLPDIGIAIFGPHVQRDAFKKAVDYGVERFGMQCKDRRTQAITKEQFAIINYVCKNPLSEEIIDVFDGKELFIGFWKVPDGQKLSVPEVLLLFADEITKPRTLPADEYRETEEVEPPIVKAMKLKVEYELPDDEECPAEAVEPSKEKQPKQSLISDQPPQAHEETDTVVEEPTSEAGSEEGENEGEAAPTEPTTAPQDIDDFDDNISASGEEEEEPVEETPQKNICSKTVTMPAIWVPKDSRTHAALIYVLFRQQTAPFLPPDPVPEPPHVIMAFDTYKKRDLVDFAERNKDDIPMYGFFTSDDADEAQFIANSKQKYAHHTASGSDKLVFKVNKRTSHTMLSLATYGPTYVSPNVTIGQEEALKFFPESYVTAEQEMLEALKAKEEKAKKRKSGDKAEVEKEISYEELQTQAQAAAEAEAQAAEAEAAESAAMARETVEGIEGADEAHGEGEIHGDGEYTDEGYDEGGEIGEGADLPTPAVAEAPAVNPAAEVPPATETPRPPAEAPVDKVQAETAAAAPEAEAAVEAPAAAAVEAPAAAAVEAPAAAAVEAPAAAAAEATAEAAA